jgi:DNA-binding IclR family transcriptional regulator
MKQSEKTAIIGAAITLLWWAPPVQAQATVDSSRTEPRQPYTGPSLLAIDKDLLALALRDYGMWREEQDRNTFPSDMPRAGEPYDPVTGNAIRNREGQK